jgi:uncharacterized DUF497 family protein
MEQYFEWDEAKNRKNQKKHDVSFETASLVLMIHKDLNPGQTYRW